MSMIIPNLEELVPEDNHYRKLLKLVDFNVLTRPLKKRYSAFGRGGYPISVGFKCLLVQAIQDLSDRQLEVYLRDSLSAKLFCGFGLTQHTPDHSYFGKLRDRITTPELAKLFSRLREALKQAGLIREVFTFVDATELQNRIWLGYKRHVSVDMSVGLIHSVAVTPANVPDSKGLKNVCPNSGMIFADKAYCEKPAREAITRRGCHSGAILKANMLGKNRDKDRWLSSVRMPFEGTFAHLSKRARYRGVVKVQFQVMIQALAFNFARLLRINSPPLMLRST